MFFKLNLFAKLHAFFNTLVISYYDRALPTFSTLKQPVGDDSSVCGPN